MEIEGSLLNGENPYPNIKNISVTATENEETKKELNLNYGNVNTILPYTMQDDYVRGSEKIKLDTAVLENDKIKATFLIGYGARLWSLFDKETGRELLHRNEVFRPSNLAVRNAWFAGGVEWNIGFRGHTPFTFDNVFAEELYDEDLGCPVLKFFEWERKRKAAYFVYAYLPDGSDRLMIRVKIKNYSGEDVPMYWWSNIAVPETTDTRVIVPSKYSWAHTYVPGITKTPVPYSERTDVTYSVQHVISKDFFFHIDKEQRKYIAAVDKNGFGLLHLSSPRLKSRKLFVWGMRRSYRNWQDLLSKNAHPYIEIQGGIAQTQMECIKMPKDAEWDWIETYGKISVNPEMAHSKDWNEAVKCTNDFASNFDNLISEDELSRARKYDTLEGKRIANGSGWAKVENAIRKENGVDIMPEFENVTLSEAEQMWVDLIDGKFPCPADDKNIPVSFSVDNAFLSLLENYVQKNANNWFALYTLAVGYAGLDMNDKAMELAKKSAEIYKSKYNIRLIACLYNENDNENAVKYIKEAFEMSDKDYCLTKETFEILRNYGRYDDIISYYNSLDTAMKNRGRMKMYALNAYIQTKNYEECEKLVSEKFVVDDLREGEQMFTKMWYDFCYLKMEKENIVCENPREYADINYEMPEWFDYFKM